MPTLLRSRFVEVYLRAYFSARNPATTLPVNSYQIVITQNYVSKSKKKKRRRDDIQFNVSRILRRRARVTTKKKKSKPEYHQPTAYRVMAYLIIWIDTFFFSFFLSSIYLFRIASKNGKYNLQMKKRVLFCTWILRRTSVSKKDCIRKLPALSVFLNENKSNWTV